jgi:hypothetical protein
MEKISRLERVTLEEGKLLEALRSCDPEIRTMLIELVQRAVSRRLSQPPKNVPPFPPAV